MFILFFSTSCTGQPPSTPFRPPTKAPPSAALATSTSESELTPSTQDSTALTSTPEPCTNDLTFSQDLTVPDGTIVGSGEIIDKQWLVTNSGTCDWDSRYRLKLAGGEALSATSEQALYPARAGIQATLRIMFTAPLSPGTFQSAWQAFAPDGSAFGDLIYMQIIVE